jgi:ferredoxin-type protein NapH
MKNKRKGIRYLRWSSKAAFLIFFMIPVVYIFYIPGTPPDVPVVSLSFGGLTNFYHLSPLTHSVCQVWLSYYGDVSPGAWFLCPVGAVSAILTGTVTPQIVLFLTIIAMLLFIIPIFLFGNVFCSWACPVGTVVDSFDKFVEKFLPKREAKRNRRYEQNKQSKKNKSRGSVLCPSCPASKLLSSRSGVLAYGILGSAIISSIILKFNVFCVVCPMGILSSGIMHFKSISMVLPTFATTGRYLFNIIELWAIPMVAVLSSLRERRYWCRKLCPLGGLLSGVGAFNPLIKPKVKKEKCIMKGCPDECTEYRTDYCIICRYEDERKCEKVCPVDINLVDNGSLHKCTKCMECYIVCEHDAVNVELIGKPDIMRIGGFLKRLKKSKRQNQKTI